MTRTINIFHISPNGYTLNDEGWEQLKDIATSRYSDETLRFECYSGEMLNDPEFFKKTIENITNNEIMINIPTDEEESIVYPPNADLRECLTALMDMYSNTNLNTYQIFIENNKNCKNN